MNFNIEEYLNSLPLDTTKIIVSGKGLTYLPDLTRFKQLRLLDCSYNEITYLPPLNNNLQVLVCYSNQLTELPHLNDNLQVLICCHNKLTELPRLNNNLRRLECYINKLTELPPLNNNLEYLDCSKNQLTWLPPLNNNLNTLWCYNINIFNKNTYFNDLYGKKISILRNFRYTYYLLKYKKHFKRWLWEKVREPKIMAKFHPLHLTNLLDSDDLEVFLEDWINK